MCSARISDFRLRLLQIRRLKSANSRFSCVSCCIFTALPLRLLLSSSSSYSALLPKLQSWQLSISFLHGAMDDTSFV